MSPAPAGRKRLSTRAFLFSDLRGYTDFVEQRGDAAATQLLRGYRALVRREVARHDGAEVKTEGDSFYIVFRSPSAALDCAVELLRRADARNAKEPDFELRIGIGLHAGETIEFDDQFVGSAVIVGSRLCSRAKVGELLISDTFRGLVRTGQSYEMEDRGPLRLKGVSEKVRAWSVRWSPDHVSRSQAKPHRERGAVLPPTPAPAIASAATVSREVHPSTAASSAADRRILCPVLIGRASELDRLGALLVRTMGSSGHCALLSGEAGVGKTALLRRFTTLARDAGARVLLGECTEIDARRPFGPFMDIAHALDRVAALPVAPRDAVTAAADRYRVHSAFTNLVTELARERPVVIVIEDLHWADEATLELFPHLARRLRDAPVLLIGTYRSDELHRRHPLRPVLAELSRNRVADDIALRRLSEDEVADFLREAMRLDRSPTAEFRQAIFESCEGNPLFIEEALRALVERGDVEYREGSWRRTKEVADIAIPDTLRDAVLERFRTLPTDAQTVLRHAAVIGQSFDFDLLLGVTGSDEAILVSSLRAAIEMQLVLEIADGAGPDRYAFRHALTRESVLLELLQRERRRMHASVGLAIEARGREDVAAHAEELAYHFDEAKDQDRAFRYHDLASREAYRVFAFARAARHLERSVELARDDEPTLGELQLRLADSVFLAAMPERALRAAKEALQWFEQSADLRGAGMALTRIAAYLWFLGETIGARATAEDAAGRLEPLGKSPELAGAYAQVARLAYLDGESAIAADWGERAVSLARETTALAAEVDALITLGSVESGWLGRSDGVARLREGVDLAEAHDMVEAAMRGFHNLVLGLYATGSSGAEVSRVYEEMFSYARDHGFRHETTVADEAFYAFPTGDWDAVLKLVHEARGESIWFAQLQLLEAFISTGRAGPEQSVPLLDASRRRLSKTSTSHKIFGGSLLCRTALFAGDHRSALNDLDPLAEDVLRGSFPEADAAVVCAMVAAIALEDSEALHRWIDIAVQEDAGPRRMTARARRAFARAERAVSERDLDLAIPLLAESAELFKQLDVPFGETLARRRRVELLLQRNAAGDRDAAQTDLAAILPYWRTAKATWYLGELERWAADHGLTFPVEARPHDVVVGGR